jgi:hypothetical protein
MWQFSGMGADNEAEQIQARADQRDIVRSTVHSAAHITSLRVDLDEEEPSHTLRELSHDCQPEISTCLLSSINPTTAPGCRFRLTPCLFDRKATKAA